MSQENVELSKRVVDAWNRRDVEATVALSDPEVVWHPVLEESIEGETYRGHAGLRQYYEDLAEQGVESQGKLAEFRDLGDRVSRPGSAFVQIRDRRQARFGGRPPLEMEGREVRRGPDLA